MEEKGRKGSAERCKVTVKSGVAVLFWGTGSLIAHPLHGADNRDRREEKHVRRPVRHDEVAHGFASAFSIIPNRATACHRRCLPNQYGEGGPNLAEEKRFFPTFSARIA
jgi:hypothetical protein